MLRIVSASLPLRPVFCALLLVMCISLGTQARQLQHLLDDAPPISSSAEIESVQRFGINAASLFGSPPTYRAASKSLPRLRLLACFVQTNPRQSIALLALENNRPQRLREGEEIEEGVQIERIGERGIVISRNGHMSTIGLQGLPAMAEVSR